MQTCGLRAVSRGEAPPADSGPLPAQVAPDQEGRPAFSNPFPPTCAVGSRRSTSAETHIALGGRSDLRLMGAPVLLARCRTCRSRCTRCAYGLSQEHPLQPQRIPPHAARSCGPHDVGAGVSAPAPLAPRSMGRNGEARADLHDKSRVLSAEFGGPWRMAQRKKTAGPLPGPCLFPGPSCRRSCRRSWSEPRPCSTSLPARPAFEQAWLARGGHRGHPFCCVPSGVEICFPHHVPSVPLPVVNPSLPRRRSGTAVGPARTARPDVPATADARPCHA